jgi:hypothetical protein
MRRILPVAITFAALSLSRWYMVCALRHWLGRDELRFLLI